MAPLQFLLYSKTFFPFIGASASATLSRTSVLNTLSQNTILEAMVNSPFKAISGKVIYYNTKDNSIFRVVEFKYAYIVYYKEVYNVDRKRQMYSTITFSADIIMIGDAYLSNQW